LEKGKIIIEYETWEAYVVMPLGMNFLTEPGIMGISFSEHG